MTSDLLFRGIFENEAAPMIDLQSFLIAVGSALLIGFFIAGVHTYKSAYTKSFLVTLATLPAIVAMVIMMVSGNLGAGVAVAGTFSLVRFRSAPGTAKEIGAIFLAMGTGLAAGMGYIGYAFIFAVVINVVILIYTASNLGEGKDTQRTMRITIPENLDYHDMFDDLFERYTMQRSLTSVKTTNMGSLFRLTYDLILVNSEMEKDFIDELRTRNGNLEIIMSKEESLPGDL